MLIFLVLGHEDPSRELIQIWFRSNALFGSVEIGKFIFLEVKGAGLRS